MKFCSDGDLFDWIFNDDIRGAAGLLAHSKRAPVLEEWMNQIVRGVQHCHSVGLAHRDLKPENIFMRGGSNEDLPASALVGDFGLTTRSIIDGSTRMLGTSLYLSPEGWAAYRFAVHKMEWPSFIPPRFRVKMKSADWYASDVWALGLMYIECFTGHRALRVAGKLIDRGSESCGEYALLEPEH